MTRLAATDPPAGGLTIRAIGWIVLAGLSCYVALIGVVLIWRIVPQATALRTRGAELQVAYVALRSNAARINRSLNATDSLFRAAAHRIPFDTVAAGRIRAELLLSSRQAVALVAGGRLAQVSGEMRRALAEAAETETHLTPQLLEVLASLELADFTSADRAQQLASHSMQRLWDLLGRAQILGIENIVTREQALGEATAGALRSLGVWIGLGLLLLPLLALWLNQRIFRPLAEIDAGLRRIGGGRLETPVPVSHGDELGRLSAHLNHTMDVLRERAELERRHALHLMERFGLVLDESASEIYLFEMDSLGVVLANRGLLSNLGYTATELQGQTPMLFLADQSVATLRRLLEPLGEGHRRQLRVPMRHRRRDGSYYPVDVTFQRSQEARPPVFLAIAEDLSERIAAEEALRQSEERYRVAFEQAAVGIAEVGLDGRFTRVNDALCETLGFTVDELLTRGFRDVSHPDEAATDEAEVAAVLAGQQSAIRRTKRYLRKDGVEVLADLSATVVRDAAGAPRFFISIVEDITERRQLESQLAQSQKMEAIGRLAGGVAHDFNNLLTVITTYAQLTAASLQPDDPRRADVEEVVRAAQRAAGLTRQLLSFARRQPIEPRAVDLSELVLNLDGLLRRTLGEDVELVTMPATGLWPVLGDPGQLEQVLMNLAVNARDAMPNGGTLTLQTENRRVDPRIGRAEPRVMAGDYVVLLVEDTGSGMSAEVKARLFEPFFTTKEVGKGTGLGLATCYGIIQNAGGWILVDSEEGKGSRFQVFLPRATSTPRSAPPPPLEEHLPRGDETVLVVEDESQVRELIRRTLTGAGYTVVTARNGEEAIQVGRQHLERLSLILTDVVLPLKSGPEVVRTLRALRPELRVLFTSGYSEHPVILAEDLGLEAAFLAKPFTAAMLAQRVRAVLDRPRNS